MAIVPLSKLTIFGTTDQQQLVLDQLQQLGCVHLVPLREAGESTSGLGSGEAIQAYRYLLRSPIKRRPATDSSKFDREALVRELLTIKDRRAELRAERDELLHAIELVSPWGDFQLPAEDELSGQKFFFYKVRLREQSHLPKDLISQVVARDNRFAYLVVIAGEEPVDLAAERVEPDPRPWSQLQRRLEEVEEELDDLHWQRVTLTRWQQMLRDDLDAADDQAAKLVAAKGIQADEAVFALRGWMPTVAAADVRALAERNQLAVTIEPPGEDDVPPTLLENPERVAGAESCVTFYITPAYHAWDPTTIVFFSFSLFFAMIISDAGYGFFMAVILTLFWRQIGMHKSGRRIRNLLLGIVSATIIYGVLIGSYFGVQPATGSLPDLLRIRIDGQPMMENQNAMMAIAVAIGVAHLSLANVLAACRDRKQLRWVGHLGWAMLMIGAFLIGWAVLMELESLRVIGVGLASLAGIGILFFSSDRPLLSADWKVHGMRLVDGLMQLTNLSKAFGDVLSYLRLFALGLASAQLALTFNGLASGALEKGGIGVLLAMVILVAGHGINFLLALMGGVVHGLRLNCIEFFNWGLNQEGYAFQPFRKKANR